MKRLRRRRCWHSIMFDDYIQSVLVSYKLFHGVDGVDTTRWTREILYYHFSSNHIYLTNLNDFPKGEEIKGSFYEQELQITEF